MGTELSPATLNVFDSVAIMLLIPVVDRILYPSLAACGIRLSMLSKMGIGFGFALLSVLTAGFVERMRRDSPLLPPFEMAGLEFSRDSSVAGGLLSNSSISVMATAVGNLHTASAAGKMRVAATAGSSGGVPSRCQLWAVALDSLLHSEHPSGSD